MCQSLGLLQQKLNEAVFWVSVCILHIPQEHLRKIHFTKAIFMLFHRLGEGKVFILIDQCEERLET